VQQASATGPSRALRTLYAAAAFVVVVAGIQLAAPLLVPLLLSIFIAIVCAPVLTWLKSKRVPVVLALVIVIAGLMLIALGFIVLMGSSINSFSQNLPTYEASLKKTVDSVFKWLDQYKSLQGLEQLSGQDFVTSIRKSLDVGAAVQFAGGMVSSLGGAFGSAFMVALTVVFILLEAAGFPSKLAALSGDSQKTRQQFNRIVADVRHYLVLKTIMCFATGLLTGLFLFFMGLDYPFLWGTLAFLLNYVPNIGSFIAAIPAVILALVQLGWEGAAWIIVGYIVINMLIGNVIEPRVFGRGLGLSPLVIFLGLVLWGWILGPVGMVLSAPLTMVVKITLESQPDAHWIVVLLSSDASVATPPVSSKTAN